MPVVYGEDWYYPPLDVCLTFTLCGLWGRLILYPSWSLSDLHLVWFMGKTDTILLLMFVWPSPCVVYVEDWYYTPLDLYLTFPLCGLWGRLILSSSWSLSDLHLVWFMGKADTIPLLIFVWPSPCVVYGEDWYYTPLDLCLTFTLCGLWGRLILYPSWSLSDLHLVWYMGKTDTILLLIFVWPSPCVVYGEDWYYTPLDFCLTFTLWTSQDTIRGIMSWRKFPSQGLTSLSNTPTLTNVWVPRW